MPRRLFTLTGHNELLTTCIKPDGKLIASGGLDGVRIWDAAYGKQLGPVLFDGEFCSFAGWTYSGSELVLAFLCRNPQSPDDWNGKICIVDGQPPFAIRKEHFFSEAVYSAMLSENGRVAVCATSRGAKMWVTEAYEDYSMAELGEGRFTSAVRIPANALPIGRQLGTDLFVLGSWGAKVFVCPVREAGLNESPQYIKLYYGEANAGPMRGDINCVGISPDWQLLITGHRDGELLKWNWLEAGACECKMKHENGVTACAWSPDGRFIGSGAAGGSVAFWEAESEELIEMWDHGTYVTACAWHPKQEFFLTASNDNNVIAWEPPR